MLYLRTFALVLTCSKRPLIPVRVSGMGLRISPWLRFSFEAGTGDLHLDERGVGERRRFSDSATDDDKGGGAPHRSSSSSSCAAALAPRFAPAIFRVRDL